MKKFFEDVDTMLDLAIMKTRTAVTKFKNGEKGSTVEVVIIVAIFAAVAVFVATKIATSIKNKGNEAVDIIDGAKF